MDNQKNIGIRIRKAREAAGLTQEQLGGKLGYSAMGISYLEQGVRKIKIEHLEKIASEVNVSISYFLEPVAPAAYPNTTYGRISGELNEEKKKEVNKKIADFDRHVESFFKKQNDTK